MIRHRHAGVLEDVPVSGVLERVATLDVALGAAERLLKTDAARAAADSSPVACH
jgi:hypothetical protein